MSTLRVNTITDTSGGSSSLSVPGAAKAWVSFNGTGTVAIRASLNVSSITDNGTGDYTVNFTNALADANYAVVGSGQAGVTDNAVIFKIVGTSDSTPTLKSSSAVRIGIGGFASGTSYIGLDCTSVSVAVFR